MSYTSVFGGTTIFPSDVSYLSIALAVDTPLEWPLESSGALDPAARIIDVTPSAGGYSIDLPDATLTGAGQTILFNNIGVTHSFFVKDFAGNTLATVAPGTQWQVYLAAVTTPAGTWRVFRYGASTATVQPSALAGYGLTVTGSTLSQSLPVTTLSTTGVTVSAANRASAFVWTATGAGTLNLLTAAAAGNNFFIFVRNEGGGDMTVEPAGTETINSDANLTLRPGDSATVITDGISWFTIGLGRQAVFAFDYTSISVTGGNYTLAGAELNRIAYKFVGLLTSDVYIIVPPTVQQYWVNNATTGPFSLFIRTSGGTPKLVGQGAKGIYYCDGTNIILGSDPTSFPVPVTIPDGGTGATTASAARLNLGITLFADPIVTATSGASVRTTIGAAASGVNGDITSLTGLTTALSVAQGGTGAATLTGYVKGSGAAALTAASTIPGSDISGNITGSAGNVTGTVAVANGGTGQTTYTDGQLLIGNTTGNTLAKAALTAGSGISITNGAGTITIAATTSGADPLTLSVVPAAAPAAGSLSLGETTVGVEMLSQISGAGWQQNFNPMIGRQRTSGYMFPLGQTTPATIEGTPIASTIVGTNSSRTYSPSTYFEATLRIGYVSAATAGSVSGLYGPSGSSRFCAIGSGGLNGFLYIAHFGVSDAATVSGARMFVGLANSVAVPTNVDPGAQTNQIGVAQLSTSNNLHIVFGGSSAQTPIDLGASFPANTLSVDMYELVLFSSKSDNTKVTYQVTRLNTGSVTSGTLTNTTPGTTLPAVSTPMGIRNWRSNNATALAVGLDLSSIVIHQDF